MLESTHFQHRFPNRGSSKRGRSRTRQVHLGADRKPSHPGYVVKGLAGQIQDLKQKIDENHDETAAQLSAIQQSINGANKANANRFDRLGQRIDRLIESQSGRRPR